MERAANFRSVISPAAISAALPTTITRLRACNSTSGKAVCSGRSRRESRRKYLLHAHVPISRFRKDIFSLAEAALTGTVVEFTHKRVTFRVIPEQSTDKIRNITPLEVIDPAYSDNLESGTIELRREMEKDWSKL